MSDTAHHRKPGTPKRPGKGHLPRDTWTTTVRHGRFDDLSTFEPVHVRRTR